MKGGQDQSPKSPGYNPMGVTIWPEGIDAAVDKKEVADKAEAAAAAAADEDIKAKAKAAKAAIGVQAMKDLKEGSKAKKLSVHYHPKFGVFISDLTEQIVHSDRMMHTQHIERRCSTLCMLTCIYTLFTYII